MRRTFVLLLGAGLLAGCGGSPSTDLSTSAASALQKDTASLAAAARSGNGAAVQAAVVALRAEVAAQRTRNGLSSARAQRVLAAADRVAADVPVPTPTPTVSPTPTPVTPSRPERGKRHKHSDGGGNQD
ncbi:MAG: hypothetical protein JWM02_1040 [Frankiales bacterium]|nr:hypothetical protein [Frankiales bacterium]